MALVVVAICGGVWLAMLPKEPVYQGKPLRYWLAKYDVPTVLWSMPRFQRLPTSAASRAALREIGTNAIPTLLEMLRERDSPLKEKFIELARGQRLYKVNWRYREAALDGYDAMVAFKEMDGVPTGLVPELVKIYDLNPNPCARQFAVAIASCITNEPEQAGTFLLRALKETNDLFVRIDALVSLATVKPPAEEAVPVLIKCLSDTNDIVRNQAAIALAEYGPDARAAVPQLIKLIESDGARPSMPIPPSIFMEPGFLFGDMTQTNIFFPAKLMRFRVSGAEVIALWRIDPEAAKKEGLLQPPTYIDPRSLRLREGPLSLPERQR
jgi:hypothetical protein